AHYLLRLESPLETRTSAIRDTKKSHSQRLNTQANYPLHAVPGHRVLESCDLRFKRASSTRWPSDSTKLHMAARQ
ncbi:unnamed protein product, partial [Mycena citricolor]